MEEEPLAVRPKEISGYMAKYLAKNVVHQVLQKMPLSNSDYVLTKNGIVLMVELQKCYKNVDLTTFRNHKKNLICLN